MKYCRTNKLNITINTENITRDFSIVKFSTSDNYIKHGAMILDEVSSSLPAKSIAFERGKSFYSLFEKKTLERIDLSKELKKNEKNESISFKILKHNEIKDVPKHTLTQLLINSISAPNHRKLSFNNLTGKLYLFSQNYIKASTSNDKEQIFKIIGLELNISPNLSLQLNVRTFSSILLSKKMNFSKRKFNEYPRYTFVHATGTLRRVLNSDNKKAENQYILKQTSHNGVLEKNNIPFLNFENLEGFNKSKIGILNTTLINIEEKLSNYLTIEFHKVPIKNTVRYNRSFKIERFKEKIFLLDLINDEDSQEQLQEVQNNLKELTPNSIVKIVKRENSSGFNLKLIHNKSYYERYNINDPYKSSNRSQHFTIEDFKTNSKATLKALIIESIIKNDIKNNQISIINWENYNFTEKWIFGEKINDHFFFLSVYSNGSLKFEKFEPDLFNQSEYDILCDIFDNDSNIEFISQDDKGNINIIKRTQNFTIPDYKTLYCTLRKENKELVLTKNEAIRFVIETFEDTEKKNAIVDSVNTLETWNKKQLLTCFANRIDKKKFVDKVANETGEVLKSYLRDKTRYEVLDSQLDIHLFHEKEKYFYYIGTKGEGIQQQMPRASIIREIESYNGSEFFFENILPLMNVDFVKNGDLTAIPFPLKYLREWVQVLGTTRA